MDHRQRSRTRSSGRSKHSSGQEDQSITRLHFNPKENYSVSSSDTSSGSEEEDDDQHRELLQLQHRAGSRKEDQSSSVTDGHVKRVKRLADSLSSLGTQAKEPWVPAPGRTTRPRSAITNSEASATAPPHQTKLVSHPTKSQHSSAGVGDGITVLYRRNPRSRNRHNLISSNTNKVGPDIDMDPHLADGPRVPGLLSGYTLQSKDSLVDVAAVLKERRGEVLQLWQQNISNAAVVEEVEKANQLAIEAERDVIELKQSIQDLEQKSELSKPDTEMLNHLRDRILSRLEQFERTHAQIQANLCKLGKNAVAASSTAVPVVLVGKKSPTSANLATNNRSSQTPRIEDDAEFQNTVHTFKNNEPHKSSNSNNSLVYLLKERKNSLVQLTDSSENEAEQEMLNNMQTRRMAPDDVHQIEDEHYEVHETNLHRHKKSIKLCQSSTTGYPLKKTHSLDRISEEKSKASSTKSKSKRGHPSSKNVAHHQDVLNNSKVVSQNQFGLQRTIPRLDMTDRKGKKYQEQQEHDRGFLPSSSTSEEGKPFYFDREDLYEPVAPVSGREPNADVNYYRYKLQKLHRQLLEQDAKYELLSRDVQKFESQSGFDLMLFKSTVASRLEELEPYPELLAVTEKRLAETLQSKLVLEADLQAKGQELSSAKSENVKLTKELNDTKVTLSSVQERFDHMTRKVAKYQRLHEAYETRITSLQQELDAFHRKAATTTADGRVIYCNHTKTAIYEDRIAELKRELKKECKNVALLKESKESVEARMSQRLQQVLTSLEETRARNRELVKQLRFIHTSYHELFPSAQVPSIPGPLRSGLSAKTAASVAATVTDIRRNLEGIRLNLQEFHPRSTSRPKTEKSSRSKIQESIHNDLREESEDS